MKVFSEIVGQDRPISILESAINAASQGSNSQEMTHAWLFTGPPGSGRSNLAIAFAAALVCKNGGCNECRECETAKNGTHPDVEIVKVEGVSIKIDEVRDLVARSAWGASTSPWRIVIIEDCDRMTEAASNALLKAIEEPGAQTIWLLCAPTLHDVLPTIRSRCRNINLTTPSTSAVANFLEKNMKASKESASLAAKISQGHIGKARLFLESEDSRSTRKKIFMILSSAKDHSSAISAAESLLDLAKERTETRLANFNEREEADLRAAYQGTSRGLISGGAKVLKDLEKEQKARTTRTIKDELDSYLLDYATFLRDCLGPIEEIINEDMAEEISKIRAKNSPELITELALAVNRTREVLLTNAAQLLALEALFLEIAPMNRGN